MKPLRLLSLLLFMIVPAACNPSHVPVVIETATSHVLPTETLMTPTSIPEPTSISGTAVPLQRGINLGNMLEAPREGDWGLSVHEEYFDLIEEAGFDFVRLPVRWNTHADEAVPYTIDAAFFARVDQIVNWALRRDLAIILDFHHYEEMMTDPAGNKERYLAIWQQLAEHYKDYPSKVLFELLNEPNNQMDAAIWQQDLTEALDIVRQSNPTRGVIIGPINWNSHFFIPSLVMPDDEHILVTFHYYLPFQFTHQGAEWVEGSVPWLGAIWEGTETDKAEITDHFDSVAAWAQRNGNVRILLGEFGAYSKADMASRTRWMEFVARQAERHGFAWAYWEFAAGFGIYDPYAKVWKKDLLKALIP